MKLGQALSIFQDLELKMSEAYLRCSLNFSHPEAAAFFSELADAEAGHARALDSLMKRPEVTALSIDIPQSSVDVTKALIDSKITEIKSERNLDRAMELLADLEQSELNTVFDSIVRGLAEFNIAHLELTTKQHIRFIQEKAAKFDLTDRTEERLQSLMVKDRSYYRLFTD